MTVPASAEPKAAFEFGRVVEALSQNTATLAKLAAAVEENSRYTVQLDNRQSRLESVIEDIQAEQKKVIHLSLTGHTDEIEVRRRLEYLDRLYRRDLDNRSAMAHGKKAMLAAAMVAVMWWGWAVLRDAAVSEVSRHMIEIRERK